jgi:hypothetical protein
MGHIVLKLFPDGRVEQSVRARSWKERELLLAFGLHLQPGLAALDVAAHIWRDLYSSSKSSAVGGCGRALTEWINPQAGRRGGE